MSGVTPQIFHKALEIGHTPHMRLQAVLAFMLSSTFVPVAAGQDVQAAAAAYARGQQAQLSGDNASAASLFELADQAAPSPQALRSAIRNHREAGQLARAATLSIAALHRYAEEPETTALAHEVLATARESLGRVRVRCEPACSLAIDGRAAHHEPVTLYDGFHEPGERALSATWPDRPEVSESVSLTVGETSEVSLEAPALPEPVASEVVVLEADIQEPLVPEPTLTTGQEAPAAGPAAEPDGGLHPAVFLSALGVTVLGGALITWSGIDVLDASDAYAADPTRGGYDAGVAAELRTNALVIGTAVVGLSAVLLALFTDWGDDDPSISIGIEPDGGFALLRAPFGGASAGGR